MEGVIKRYEKATKALATLDEAIRLLADPKHRALRKSLRDSMIQRFEYSIDTFWKFIKIYLQEYHRLQIPVGSPRAIIDMALQAQLIAPDEQKKISLALRARNETSHAYNESLAEEIAANIPEFYATLSVIIARIQIPTG